MTMHAVALLLLLGAAPCSAFLWPFGSPEPVVTGEPDTRVAVSPDPTTRIAFASCKDGTGEVSSMQNRGIDFDWSTITERRPHAFVWAGDAIYGDSYLSQRRMPAWACGCRFWRRSKHDSNKNR